MDGIDAPTRHSHVSRRLEILLLAAAVSALLLFLFPGLDFQDPRHLARPDELSIAYLRLVLRGRPEDASARLLLAQEEVALGHWDEAREDLAALVGRRGELGARARLVALELDRHRLSALPAGDPRRSAVQAEVATAIRRVQNDVTAAHDLRHLAELSLAIEAPADAAALYERLAGADDAGAARWLGEAARWHEAAGAPLRAGRAWARAAQRAPDASAAHAAALRALDALRAGGRPSQALADTAALVERLPRDTEVLQRAIAIALAAGDAARARQWGERVLAAAPDDEAALRRQVDLDLQAAQPEAAYRHMQALLARAPADTALRRRYADIATWAGHAPEALSTWSALARRGSEPARARALELARQLSDTDRVIELLEMRARSAHRVHAPAHLPRVTHPRAPGRHLRPTGAPLRMRAGRARRPPAPRAAARSRRRGEFELPELLMLVEALETKGEPRRAIAVLDQFRYNFRDRPDFWTALSALYERAGDLEPALACAEQLTRIRGTLLTDALRQAELMWRLHRPEAALARLVAARGQARPGDDAFWEMMGDLAWTYEHAGEATAAYEALWSGGKRDRAVGERLLRLYMDAGRIDDTIRAGREGFAATSDAFFLATAIDAAAGAARWAELEALVNTARAHEARCAELPQCWLGRAALAVHEERFGEAETAFRRALALDPLSVDGHRDWIAAGVRAQDAGMVRRALAAWGPAAEAEPEAWDVLSDAYELLGDEPRHLRFARLAHGPGAPAADGASASDPRSADDDMDAAIARRDRAEIARLLRTSGRALTLATRVEAERALGLDEDAWRLLSQPRSPGAGDGSVLSETFRELRDEHLSGSAGNAGLQSLGALDVWAANARLELRHGAWGVGLDAEANRLLSSSTPRLLARGYRELHAGGLALLRENLGETMVRVGAHHLPTGNLPYAAVVQELHTPQHRFEARVQAAYDDLPTNTALVRAAGVRHGVELETVVDLGRQFDAVLGASVNRYATRTQDALGSGPVLHAELGRKLKLGRDAQLRLRVDGHADYTQAVVDPPPALRPFVTRGDDLPDLLPNAYSTAGAGLALANADGAVGDGHGPAHSLHYLLDAWAGWLIPANKLTMAFEGGLGFLLTSRQELAATGFLYTDRGGEAGQRFLGLVLRYCLRWS